MVRLVVGVLTLICALAGTAAAKVHELGLGGVTVDVPKKWKAKRTDIGLFVETRDGVVRISMIHKDGADFAAYWEEHRRWAASVGFEDPVVGADQEEVIGALTGRTITVTGKHDGVAKTATWALVATPRGHMMSMYMVTVDGKLKKHRKELTRMLGSLAGKPHRIDDEGFRGLTGHAQAFVEKVATAIEKNDRKGFVAAGGAGLEAATIKKAKKLTALLGLPATGGWHVAVEADGMSLWIWRGGVSTDVAMLRVTAADGGGWQVSEVAVRSHAEPPPPVTPVGGWCATHAGQDLDFCEPDQAECERIAGNWKRMHDLDLTCVAAPVIYCEQDTRWVNCFTTQERCDRMRGNCAPR